MAGSLDEDGACEHERPGREGGEGERLGAGNEEPDHSRDGEPHPDLADRSFGVGVLLEREDLVLGGAGEPLILGPSCWGESACVPLCGGSFLAIQGELFKLCRAACAAPRFVEELSHAGRDGIFGAHGQILSRLSTSAAAGISSGRGGRYTQGMCGRFELSETPLHLVAKSLGLMMDETLCSLDRRRFNIAPGQRFACVRGRRELVMTAAVWGIQGRDGATRINARVEGLESVWLGSPARARALIPADGFVEWNRSTGRRAAPSHLRFAGGVSWLGAVLDLGERDPSRGSCAVVVTCEATGRVAPLHGRMPLMFGSWEHAHHWLHVGSYERATLTRVASTLEVTPISTRINATAHDDPECLNPREDSPQLELFGPVESKGADA